jgi:acetoin utilization protein AcuB
MTFAIYERSATNQKEIIVNMSVKETMSSDLVTAYVDESLSEAYAKLKKNNIRHLPVVDANEKVVGVISDRDFHRGMKFNKYEEVFFEHSDILFVDGAKVCNFMSWPVKTIAPSASLADASWKMINDKISALLVTSDDNVEGIITHEDLLRVLVCILSPPPTPNHQILSKIQEWTYKSTIGQVAKFLSDSGI